MNELDRAREIEKHIREILRLLGEDPNREGLIETPRRVAQALLELTRSLRTEPPDVKFFTVPESSSKNLVVIRNIEFLSLCEHHLLPIVGYASIVYRPRGNKVPGLSKVIRLVQWYARRPILQERFTQELADFLRDKICAKFVYCRIVALHMCVFLRGVRSRSSVLITEALSGEADVDISSLRELARCRYPRI